MYALRGREKRKILSVVASYEGRTTRWGYTPHCLGLGAEKGPAARRRPRAAREAYSLYVPLGGGLRPPSETSPEESLRRQSRRSKVEHSHVGRRAARLTSLGTALGGPLRARALPAQRNGGGFGGGRRGPLRRNEADGPVSAL